MPTWYHITLFRSKTMLCGIDNIPWNTFNPTTHCYGSGCKYSKVASKVLWYTKTMIFLIKRQQVEQNVV